MQPEKLRPARTFYSAYNETPIKENLMTKLDFAKRAISLTVGWGTSAIITSAIQRNSAPDNAADRIAMPVATVALGWMISEKTQEFTNRKVDAAVAWYNENIKH